VAVAAVTPRVRSVVICDEVVPSLTEDGVFTLEGVRQRLLAQSFPCSVSLSLFLLLSSPRRGAYSGKVVIVNEQNGRTIRYVKLSATFPGDNDLMPLEVEIPHCTFPERGRYSFEIYFSTRSGDEALKGEHPVVVDSDEE
jgi:hypothetical protein